VLPGGHRKILQNTEALRHEALFHLIPEGSVAELRRRHQSAIEVISYVEIDTGNGPGFAAGRATEAGRIGRRSALCAGASPLTADAAVVQRRFCFRTAPNRST